MSEMDTTALKLKKLELEISTFKKAIEGEAKDSPRIPPLQDMLADAEREYSALLGFLSEQTVPPVEAIPQHGLPIDDNLQSDTEF